MNICEELSVFNDICVERCPPMAEVRGSNPLGWAKRYSENDSLKHAFLKSAVSSDQCWLRLKIKPTQNPLAL